MIKKNIRPTDSELEILQVLWDLGSGTVRDVHGILGKSKSAGYTTTLKLMQIMAEKGLLKRNTDARTHIYLPTVSRDKTLQQLVDKMISKVFQGSASGLVMQALGNHQATPGEIEQIKSYLSKLEFPENKKA
ncbi:MAG TPA: BlaI/MecI/CopY family transcriptional regulator [Chitinophagaceae bacterium]|nr:BlaI/MecI/CopY family transcriptional regulator [Chitinophagaceae bacterium]